MIQIDNPNLARVWPEGIRRLELRTVVGSVNTLLPSGAPDRLAHVLVNWAVAHEEQQEEPRDPRPIAAALRAGTLTVAAYLVPRAVLLDRDSTEPAVQTRAQLSARRDGTLYLGASNAARGFEAPERLRGIVFGRTTPDDGPPCYTAAAVDADSIWETGQRKTLDMLPHESDLVSQNPASPLPEAHAALRVALAIQEQALHSFYDVDPVSHAVFVDVIGHVAL